MAGIKFTTPSVPFNDLAFNGGLNSAAGPMSLRDNESPDLQNVDFNKFGSIVMRNGYTALNTAVASNLSGSISAFADNGDGGTTVTDNSHGLSDNDYVQITGTTSYNGTFQISGVTTHTFDISVAFVADDATGTWNRGNNSDGMKWFEFDITGTVTRKLVNITGGKLYKMDDLDGTWDDETNGLTITADNHCDFAVFLDTLYVVNGVDTPFQWDGGSGTATTSTLPANVTRPRYVVEFNNYLFYGDVYLSGARQSSRIYWSNLKDTGTWSALAYIDIAKDDGQVITGLKVLSDRLVIFKERSIYTLFFTGDADIPFILPGGGRTNSNVGCVAPYTIQEVENGLVFLASDGFYFFDGSNSTKISDKISPTLLEAMEKSRFSSAVAINQRNKNRYWCALTASSGTTNDRVLVWDYFNNAWTVYVGLNISAMDVVFVNGTDEQIYFGDYAGFAYKADVGTSDNPLNVATKYSAYYKTNWRPFGDLVNQKATNQAVIYYQTSNSTLTFGYSYDFSETGAPNALALPGMDYSQSFTTSAGTSVYGAATYDSTDTYARSGGDVKRRDLTGRGRVIQLLFGNATLNETFQIDALGLLTHLETNQ